MVCQVAHPPHPPPTHPYLNRFYPDNFDAAPFGRVENGAPISSGGGGGVGNIGGLAFANGLNLMDPHVRAAIARMRAMAPAHAQDPMGMQNHASDPLAVPNPWIVSRSVRG